MSYEVLPNAYIAGVESLLVFYDQDGDYDLRGITGASITFKEPKGGEVPWRVGNPIPVPDGVNPRALLIPVKPPAPHDDDFTVGTGSLTGTLQGGGEGDEDDDAFQSIPFSKDGVTVYAVKES
jgi:hypothetical protein